MEKFEERCNKLRIEHPKMEEVDVHNHIKGEIMQEFQSMTPEEWRQMVKASIFYCYQIRI